VSDEVERAAVDELRCRFCSNTEMYRAGSSESDDLESIRTEWTHWKEPPECDTCWDSVYASFFDLLSAGRQGARYRGSSERANDADSLCRSSIAFFPFTACPCAPTRPGRRTQRTVATSTSSPPSPSLSVVRALTVTLAIGPKDCTITHRQLRRQHLFRHLLPSDPLNSSRLQIPRRNLRPQNRRLHQL
jgi:hypothetical protein